MTPAKMTPKITLKVNGIEHTVLAQPLERLSAVLRDSLGLTGTKVGCDAGDCGACTVSLDGEQVCACMVPVAQAVGHDVRTIEGVAEDPALTSLLAAFRECGAAQCGICTPGMVMATSTLLARNPQPSEGEVLDAISGVLCRCTGYRKIVAAVVEATANAHPDDQANDEARAVTPREIVGRSNETALRTVGQRVEALDASAKVSGTARYGADEYPADALMLKVVRSPHSHATFALGDLVSFCQDRGLTRIFHAGDVPGLNGFGIYPDLKDQPVLAPGVVRFRGEAVLAIVGTSAAIDALDDSALPIRWSPLEPVTTPVQALDHEPINPERPTNVLIEGRLRYGDLNASAALQNSGGADPSVTTNVHHAEGAFTTPFVEHAYIEPEAGFARPLPGGRVEVYVSTQTPYMDLEEVANVLGVTHDRVRIRPSACGGGFGGKLDQSVQPLVALAAHLLDRPVRTVFSRTQSMASSTKRHPARIVARASANSDGELLSYEFSGDFDTGAYASWGPTVAGRVPVHCMGPYRVPAVVADSRAIFTHNPPAGAFRGFGIPQAAFAHETLMDELAERCGLDPLEFRRRNALKAGDETPSGQRLDASAGLVQCLDALAASWHDARRDAAAFNARGTRIRRGVGIGCMWYGCGNTALSNPSTMRIVLGQDGRLTYYNGAQDIGQGAATVMTQIIADALGVPMDVISVVGADTDLTEDAGKSSASRQTFVSGKAAQLAGFDLREQILRGVNAGAAATLTIENGTILVNDEGRTHRLDIGSLPLTDDPQGDAVLVGRGYFDPPTTTLDDNGQGVPYATYGFAAQFAEIELDLDLGTIKLRRIVAAHDVGKAVNPTFVEGQIEGGIAQGIGLALMEEYIPGRTENLHDYLIPTAGDVPPIECILIEDPEPLGAYGAKGIGEPALIPTAPAIANAVYHASGIRLRELPLLPHRVREAIAAGATNE